MSTEEAPEFVDADSSSESEVIIDRAPLWKYVRKTKKLGDDGGTWKWKRNFCHVEHSGSYTRVRTHLLHGPIRGIAWCEAVTPDDIVRMSKLVEACNERLLSRNTRGSSSSGSLEISDPALQDLVNVLEESEQYLDHYVKLKKGGSERNSAMYNRLESLKNEVDNLKKVAKQNEEEILKRQILKTQLETQEEEVGGAMS